MLIYALSRRLAQATYFRLAILGLSITSGAALGVAQQNVPFDGFESYAPGPLGDQGGWTSLSVTGTSSIDVTNTGAHAGSKCLHIYDGDASTRPKARRDYGNNTASGTIRFAVKESPITSGRDQWRIDFFSTGSGIAAFTLIGGTSISLSNSGGTLASISQSNTSYDPAGWNQFAIYFDNSAKTLAVYMNGEASAILSSADASTNWVIGKLELSVGWGSATGQAVFYDENPAPEWTTTKKLRYAPPTLVAPTVVNLAGGGYYGETTAGDEDLMVNLSPNQPRTSGTIIRGGRNVRIVGGDFGKSGVRLYGQTRSVFLEGITINCAKGLPLVNGHPVERDAASTNQEIDGIQASGAASGSEVAPDIYIQNSYISGVHGTMNKHGAGIPLQSITYRAATKDYAIITSAAHGMAVGQEFMCGPTNQAQLSDTYKVKALDPNNGAVCTATRWATWFPVTPSLTADLTGAGGYLWPIDRSETGNHSDAFQCLNEKILNIVRFYKVTMDSNYQCFIGGHGLNDSQARGLEMTRVNMRQNNVWPQGYNSMALYLGDTGTAQPGSTARMAPFPVFLDRVFIKPRPGRSLLNVVAPGTSAERIIDGIVYDVSAYSNDGGLTVGWQPALGVTGVVSYSADGFSTEPGYAGKDYADLTGANPPGLNYVSPGYSSEAVHPLVMSSVSAVPANPVVAVSASAGTFATRLDVSFSGEGHIIDLTLSNNAGGRFQLSGRNIVRSGSGTLSAGSYSVTVTATQRGDPSNALVRTLSIAAE